MPPRHPPHRTSNAKLSAGSGPFRTPEAPGTTQQHTPPHATTRQRYDRARDLPRLIQVWPAEVASHDPLVRRAIVRRIAAALRSERQRGLAGHWTYDLARHSQLAAAYRAEQRDLHDGRQNA